MLRKWPRLLSPTTSRSQKDIDDRKNLGDAMQKEREFFKVSPYK